MKYLTLLCCVALIAFAATTVEAYRKEDLHCTARHGYCQDDRRRCPGGSYKTGLCGGGPHRRCCFPEDPKCDRRGGKCKWDDIYRCHSGRYISGKCNGPRHRRCCVRDKS